MQDRNNIITMKVYHENQVSVLLRTVHACVPNCFHGVCLFATLRTVTQQALLSTGFSKQEYWRALPFPPAGDLPSLGIEPASPVALALQEDSFTAEPLGKPAYNSMELIVSTPRVVVLL